MRHMAFPALAGFDLGVFADLELVALLQSLPEQTVLVGERRTVASGAVAAFGRGMPVAGDLPIG